ncbi:hypothetical protein C8R43DRAFT_557158 [Mycena crocata]|nr:hypothetical protein C8R43DRAFT_557158 [Mycena crocata]
MTFARPKRTPMADINWPKDELSTNYRKSKRRRKRSPRLLNHCYFRNLLNARMHPSFHMRNLERLPFRIRRMAVAAAKGSVDEVQKIMVLVATHPNVSMRSLFLPVCWVNLDPCAIPTPHDMDVLISNCTELAECRNRVDDLPKGPFLALQTLKHIKDIPPRALVDLYPRIRAWLPFFDTYGGHIRTAPKKGGVDWYAMVFALDMTRLPMSLVDRQPGIGIFTAKAWKAFVATGAADKFGFPELMAFIKSHSGITCDRHIAEYVEGAGGSLEDLAQIISDHFGDGAAGARLG